MGEEKECSSKVLGGHSWRDCSNWKIWLFVDIC